MPGASDTTGSLRPGVPESALASLGRSVLKLLALVEVIQ